MIMKATLPIRPGLLIRLANKRYRRHLLEKDLEFRRQHPLTKWMLSPRFFNPF
jgi:hypothetical protein